jgi:hypothetical protein
MVYYIVRLTYDIIIIIIIYGFLKTYDIVCLWNVVVNRNIRYRIRYRTSTNGIVYDKEILPFFSIFRILRRRGCWTDDSRTAARRSRLPDIHI